MFNGTTLTKPSRTQTDFFCFHIRNFAIPILQSPEPTCAHLQDSDRTLRDGSFGAAITRHSVPGYDRTVPPGQKPFAYGSPLALRTDTENCLLSKEQRLDD